MEGIIQVYFYPWAAPKEQGLWRREFLFIELAEGGEWANQREPVPYRGFAEEELPEIRGSGCVVDNLEIVL